MEKQKMKRLLLDVTEKFHREIKAKAVISGISLKKYMTIALLEKIKRDNQYE